MHCFAFFVIYNIVIKSKECCFLEKYMQFFADAKAIEEQIVVCKNFRITLITSRLVRFEAGSYCDAATQCVINRGFEKVNFTAERNGDFLKITTNSLIITCNSDAVLEDAAVEIELTTAPYTKWHWGEKAFNNLGGTVCTLDSVNGECPLDDGICSTDGFGFIDDSTSAYFIEDGWLEPRKEGTADIYFFGYGHDYTAAVKDYYRLTGPTPMMPKYVFGNWWSRYFDYTEETYNKLMDDFIGHDIPLSVAVIDMDWHTTDDDGRDYNKDGWTGYSWNKKFFPDYKRFLKGLHDRGLTTSLSLHPADGVRYWEDMYSEMATAMGIDPETKAPVPFDILNKDFIKAYFEILHFPYEENGVDFWWMDWQQGTDYNWIHNLNGGKKNPLECVTPLWMLNHFHYLASKRNGKRGITFSRFSGHGSQRYPIGFSGDTCVTWDSLNFQPYFTATASNIGYGWWSHDIGGHYKGYRDDEMNTRWVQSGVFSPIFRLHSSKNIFAGREPWNYNKRAELIISDFMRLRHRLFPYIYTMSYRNTTEFIPLIRPMYHLYPESAEAYKARNQYFFGSELMAAPITEKGDTASDRGHSKVWFPEGTWIDFFSGMVYSGNTTRGVYRPLEQMPLFLKAGAIVPMQPHCPGKNTLGLADTADLIVAAGASGSFTLYEDDGETEAYKEGAFATTEFALDWQETKAAFKIYPSKGNISFTTKKRNYNITFRGFKKGCRFFANGKEISAEYLPEGNEYILKLADVDALNGAELTLENRNGLIHDNSDYRERICDMLYRAQADFEVKLRLIWMVDNRPQDIRSLDQNDYITAATLELLDLGGNK